VVATSVGVGAFGCGNSDEESSTQATVSKAEFIKMANHICQMRLKEKDKVVASALSELASSQTSKLSNEALAALGERTLGPVRKMTEELSELAARSKNDTRAEAIAQQLEAGLAEAEARPIILTRTDPFEKAGESAESYGLKECTF
jgi:hypothetical protein